MKWPDAPIGSSSSCFWVSLPRPHSRDGARPRPCPRAKGSESLTCCCRLAAFRTTSAPFSGTTSSITPALLGAPGSLCGTGDTAGRQLLTLKSQPQKDTPTTIRTTTGRVCVQEAHLTTHSRTHTHSVWDQKERTCCTNFNTAKVFAKNRLFAYGDFRLTGSQPHSFSVSVWKFCGKTFHFVACRHAPIDP